MILKVSYELFGVSSNKTYKNVSRISYDSTDTCESLTIYFKNPKRKVKEIYFGNGYHYFNMEEDK